MAIGASIFKVNLTLSNLNDHFYHDFSLTMAKHPSENEGRMMNRLALFCLCAHPELAFTKGLSTQDEPEIWLKDHSGRINHWIEMGQPDDKRIRQAVGKADKVSVFSTHDSTTDSWYAKIKDKVPLDRVNLFQLKTIENGPLEKLVKKSMDLSCLIEEDNLYLGDDTQRVGLNCLRLGKS